MAEGIYTEREWRKRGTCIRGPVFWGAQYVQPVKRHHLYSGRCLHAGMLLVAMVVALLLPLCWRKQVKPAAYPMAVAPQAGAMLHVRKVPGVTYAMPSGLSLVQATYSYEALCRGKLLLLDENHPLPAQAPHPNTMTIAVAGKGMVPVNELSLKTGKETIRALTALFADLRGNGCSGFVVWQGTQTPWEQQTELLSVFGTLAKNASLDAALAEVKKTMDLPGTGELLQEYTVELRMGQEGLLQPDAQPLEETVQGRQLLRFAWRNGLIRTCPTDAKQGGFRFRYVGLAHATAMTYLDVDLPTYLQILHEKKVLTVQGENGQTFVIQCIPAQGSHMVFQLPEGAVSEVSLDNTGYAVAASLLPEE